MEFGNRNPRLQFLTMSLVLGNIYDRKELWPEVLLSIARQQFNDLDTENCKKYDEFEAASVSLKSENRAQERQQRVSTAFGRQSLNYVDVKSLNDCLTLTRDVVDRYMDFIVTYVNAIRRPQLQSLNAKPTQAGTSGVDVPRLDGTPIQHLEVVDSPEHKYLSCRFMTTAQFKKCTDVASARTVLESMDCAGDKFKSLDYLLIPYEGSGRKVSLSSFRYTSRS